MSDNAVTVSEDTDQDDLLEVRIPRSILEELKWLSSRMGVTPTEALRQAIVTQAYLEKVQQSRGEILVKRGNDIRRLILKPDKG